MKSGDAARDSLIAHIDAATAALETQIPNIIAASQRLSRCLLDESRIFTCGNAGASLLAQNLTVKLMSRMERERPGLPVFCLSDSAALTLSLADHFGAHDTYGRQLRALGQPGDVLVVFITGPFAASVQQAVVAAHDRGMDVIALRGRDSDDMQPLLSGDDIEITVTSGSAMRTEEIHLLLLNLLCDELERDLFGDMT
jgi:D-sedoheptulose 7-phosphate isomerase